MIFFTCTESKHIGFKKQNFGPVWVVSLIFTGILFLVPHQITSAQTVDIPDPSLRAALALTLGKDVETDITQADMASLESLDAFESGIRNLTGLEFAINLIELRLGLNAISDISPLENMTKLTVLDLHRNQRISDVTPLSNLTNLTWLSLRGNRISDMSPLKNLTKLTYLHVAYNSIRDVSAFEGLTNLAFLDIEAHRISDLSPLINMTKLTYLDFDSNWVSDLSPLENMTELAELDASDNRISDILPLRNLTKLTYIDLDDNRISDISPLTGMTQLTWLDLDDNYNISDISPLTGMTQLTWLDLDHNAISDLSPLKNLTKLTYLDLNDNRILDVFPLNALTNLTELDLDDNQILDISALKNLTKLTLLDLHGNEIIDVSPLASLINLIELDLDDNQIVDVSPLVTLVNLETLDLDGNHISDVSPLKALVNLTVLDLSDNHISDFSPIAGVIKNLVGYDASGQKDPPITEVDVNRDGIVNVMDIALAAFYYRIPNFADVVPADIYPDVNDDGVVDVQDLVAIAAEIDVRAAAAPEKYLSKTSNLTAENLAQWIHLAKQIDPQERYIENGITVLEQLLAVITLAERLPKETALLANYPNPFNPETWIPYQLASPAAVHVSIHSADGKLVRTLELGTLPAGVYHSKSRAVYWDGRNVFGETVASGIYFYTLTAGDFTATGKMLIRK